MNIKPQFSRTAMLLGGEAVERLAASRVAVFGLGGVGGNEGAVIIAIDGEDEAVKNYVEFLEANVKGEPAVPGNKGVCETCNYRNCRYCGMKAEELPAWLKD